MSTGLESKEHQKVRHSLEEGREQWEALERHLINILPAEHTPEMEKLLQQDLEVFRRFSEGSFTPDAYYPQRDERADDGEVSDSGRRKPLPPSPQARSVEYIAHSIGGLKELDELRAFCRKKLYDNVQRVRDHSNEWKQEAEKPACRMYLDALQLINAGVMKEVKRQNRNNSVLDNAEIGDAVCRAHDKVMLSTGGNGNFERLLRSGMKQRIIDAWRSKTRPLGKDSKIFPASQLGDDFKMDNLPDGRSTPTSPALPTLDEVLEYLPESGLSSEEIRVFRAYAEGRCNKPRLSMEKIAGQLGIKPSTFKDRYQVAKRKLVDSIEASALEWGETHDASWVEVVRDDHPSAHPFAR